MCQDPQEPLTDIVCHVHDLHGSKHIDSVAVFIYMSFVWPVDARYVLVDELAYPDSARLSPQMRHQPSAGSSQKQ